MLIRFSVVFVTFMVSTSIYAESSKWDQIVKGADQVVKGSDKKQVFECVFPDAPNNEAPTWICNRYMQGMEISAVGHGKYYEPEGGKEDTFVKEKKGNYRNFIPGPVKAYTDAVIKLDKELSVRVKNRVKKYLEATGGSAEEQDKVLTAVVKKASALKSKSGKSQFSSMIKSYAETTKGKVEKISNSISKVVHNSKDCQFVYKNYLESQGGGSEKLYRAESNLHRGQCGFGQLVDDMEESGYKLLKMIKSPNDHYYVAVGVTSVSALLNKKVKKQVSKESELWKEFKLWNELKQSK